ncbi:hypothetical protein [Bhargavaea cecembensis]|uniref:hypothetical protein n=1 Tax=Bhargavaea cecembensis TaxID=394098 RepID=UPI00058BA299|nr:hypothetical protein [Bhargavaea cecembensis]
MKFTAMPFWTAGATALLVCLGLRFLQYFKFISWHPAGLMERIGVKGAAWPAGWLLLFAGLFVFTLAVYYLSMLLAQWPTAVTAFLIGIILALPAEWIILRPEGMGDFMDRLSIPFAALVLIASRFVTETAVFQKKQQASRPK